MKHAITIALLAAMAGCAGPVTLAAPSDASQTTKAAAAVADTALFIRAWEILGYIK